VTIASISWILAELAMSQSSASVTIQAAEVSSLAQPQPVMALLRQEKRQPTNWFVCWQSRTQRESHHLFNTADEHERLKHLFLSH